MLIEPLTKSDFDWIMTHFEEFWDDDATRPRHHPMFVNEFSDSAFVMRQGNRVAAYLLGFIAQSSPTAYVHMVAVAKPYRRDGLARQLYLHFIDFARTSGCQRLKATAAPTNWLSITFHTAFGMTTPEGEILGNDAGGDGTIRVVPDYSGPGIDRVVFTMDI